MRELLFRGKRTDNGKWVEGLPFYKYDSFYEEYRLHIQRIKPKVDFEIDLDTICEYTGLVDRYKKKIFEDDILCWTESIGMGYREFRGRVVSKPGGFAVVCGKLTVDVNDEITKPDFYIAGNIYDTPELIEGV
jgi:hypothetical protein